MPYLAIFGLEFENTIVIVEINALDFFLLQSLGQRQKYLTLGSKLSYLATFELEFESNFVIFEIWLIAKFCERIKMPKFGTKNAFCEYLWEIILKNHCHV